MPMNLFGQESAARTPEAASQMWVTVTRWPVLERTRNARGVLRDTERSMRRTAAPLEERLVRLVEWTEAARVVVLIGTEETPFSLLTGRAVGLPDWRLTKPCLQRLRALRQELFD